MKEQWKKKVLQEMDRPQGSKVLAQLSLETHIHCCPKQFPACVKQGQMTMYFVYQYTFIPESKQVRRVETSKVSSPILVLSQPLKPAIGDSSTGLPLPSGHLLVLAPHSTASGQGRQAGAWASGNLPRPAGLG